MRRESCILFKHLGKTNPEERKNESSHNTRIQDKCVEEHDIPRVIIGWMVCNVYCW